MTSAPTQQPRPSGIDLDALDPRTRPQDDLYRYVNGRWLATHEIPADRAVDSAFRVLHDRAEEQVRELIREAGEAAATPGTAETAVTPATPGTAATREGAADDVRGQIGRMYASFMDEERVEALGTAPIGADLALVDGATSAGELAAAMGTLQRTGTGGALSVWIDNDADDPHRYVVYLQQSGLGLPDESYYREEQYAPLREAYLGYVARILTLAGVVPAAEADAAAGTIMALETALAGHHWDVVRDRDAELTYNPMTFAALTERAPGFDWAAWATALGAGDGVMDDVVVREPEFAVGFAALWAGLPLADWALWLRLRVVATRAPFLSRALVETNFDFYGRTLSGTEEIRERWKRAVSLVEGALGEAVGELYVARHFPPEHKTHLVALVANLVEAYRQSISGLDWMSEETRARALAKLELFTPKIGYPDVWKDYLGLEIDATDLLGNVRRSSAYEHDREFRKIGKPVDRAEWFMTPQTVNAYYNPGMNEIVFPAAILQPPFFDPDADDAVNYGGICAVIGHEIGHGFDDQGSKYDGDGRLTDWWTEADRAEFEQRATALIEQYSTFSPAQFSEPHRVNGALTIGENIGDLGGLAIAIKAYRVALGGAEPPVIDGFTGIQRVMLGWAQAWRTKTRDEEALRRLATDPHSPPEFRCNGVLSNIDEFYPAFDVQPSDALYRDPALRVRIW